MNSRLYNEEHRQDRNDPKNDIEILSGLNNALREMVAKGGRVDFSVRAQFMGAIFRIEDKLYENNLRCHPTFVALVENKDYQEYAVKLTKMGSPFGNRLMSLVSLVANMSAEKDMLPRSQARRESKMLSAKFG